MIVSSDLHTKGTMAWEDLNWKTRSYSRVQAYSQSKLANILHAKELARRVEDDGISVYSLHPGVIYTDLSRHAYETWWGKLIGPCARVVTKAVMLTPRQGAQTTLYCCLEESIADDSGKYYSDCKEKEPVSAANDVKQQNKLWAISEKLVGLTE